MQVAPDQLGTHLKGQLARCYLVCGEETLILQESADAIRAAARAAGCSERERIEIGGTGDWQQLLQSAGAMSLFAERKLIELILPSGKPGTEGSKAIQEYLGFDSEDVLLIISGKIDKQSQRAKWYTALDKAGAVVTAWPIKPNQLPRWLGQRLAAAGLKADPDALGMLAERVEGNLLAAVQEIEKLKLLADGATITTDTVVASVSDNARYNVFGLVDVALAGDARGALRTLRGLRAEASQPPVVLWALFRDLKLLAQLDEDRRGGSSLQQAMNQRGVWRSRMNTVQAASQRHTRKTLDHLQSLLFNTDCSIKGLGRDNPWDLLEQAVVLLAQGPQSDASAPRRR